MRRTCDPPRCATATITCSTAPKIFITNVAVADICIVFAMTNMELGPKGASAFICHTDDPGFKLGKVEHKMGIRGSPTNEVVLDNCRIPADRLLGEEGRASASR